eukprot:504831_1
MCIHKTSPESNQSDTTKTFHKFRKFPFYDATISNTHAILSGPVSFKIKRNYGVGNILSCKSPLNETKINLEHQHVKLNFKIEQYNLTQNIRDAIPIMDANNIHLIEMTLILQLKLWIEHYGIPAVMNGNNHWNQMQRLQTAFIKAKQEADELDEETMQLMQQVFNLENDVKQLEKRYTIKCNELKLVKENIDEKTNENVSNNSRFINPVSKQKQKQKK